jgi:hypothetical protein
MEILICINIPGLFFLPIKKLFSISLLAGLPLWADKYTNAILAATIITAFTLAVTEAVITVKTIMPMIG